MAISAIYPAISLHQAAQTLAIAAPMLRRVAAALVKIYLDEKY